MSRSLDLLADRKLEKSLSIINESDEGSNLKTHNLSSSSYANSSATRQLATNDGSDAFEDKILHYKCPVIKLVRKQMTNLNSVIDDDIENLKRQNTFYGKIKRNKSRILVGLFLLFLLWLALIYGTLLGAYICSGKTWQSCRSCNIVVGVTPGLHWTRNTHSVF